MTRVVISRLPLISYGVWILSDEGEEILTSVVVSPGLLRRKLRLSMLRGNPRQPWRKLAARYFPSARGVSYRRLEKRGFRERPLLSLEPAKPKPLPVSSDPRVLLVDPDVYRWALIMIGGLLFVGVAAWGAWEAATIWADHAEQAWEQRFTTNGGGR